MTYDAWINAVDSELLTIVGLHHDDMEDYLWHDAWESGASAKETVTDFLFEVGYYAE